MNTAIVIGEPQCRDYEHSRVNAALIHTALLAYPDAHVLFYGERLHITHVRTLLEQTAGSESSRIDWNELDIPLRNAPTLRRIVREFFTLRTMLRAATRVNAAMVLYSSATELGFLMLKFLLVSHRVKIPVLVVMHGLLASLVPNAPHKMFAALRGMRLVFHLPHPRQLVYVVLGPSILRSLAELQPGAARHTVAIELPFLWTVHELPPQTRAHPSPIRFGFFGASGGRGKGFGRFVQIAEAIRPLFPTSEFTVVGHLSTDDDRRMYGPLIPDAPLAPLSQTEYAERSLRMTYAVSTTDPDVYRIGASTSFLDALSCIKPGIYLRNPYIEECFRQMGDIGYLCDSVDEIRRCILEILKEFPVERYRIQCENILRGRHIFEPPTISATFRHIVEEARKRL